MADVEVWPQGNIIYLMSDGVQFAITFPEANKLQEDLRRICVEAGITLRDAMNHQPEGGTKWAGGGIGWADGGVKWGSGHNPVQPRPNPVQDAPREGET